MGKRVSRKGEWKSERSTDVRLLERFSPLLNYRGSLAILEGGSRSGKTHAILQVLIARMMSEKLRVFAVRHDATTCRPTIVQDFQSIMIDEFRIWASAGTWNEKRMSYQFDNGSLIEFGGTSDPQKLHGHEQDILWINEAMEVQFSAWKQLTQRTRRLRILDYNPSLTHHWVFSRLMKRSKDTYLYIHSTYKDNPFLPDSQVSEIESYEPTEENKQAGTADKWHWEVYGLGKRGRREGTIFRLWDTVDKYPDPLTCQKHGYGLDFGFSQDPTALVECGLWNDALYLRQRVYEKSLLITPNMSRPGLRNLSTLMEDDEISHDAKIVADSSNPGSIADLRASGWNVFAVAKTKDSLLNGIERMKGFKIHIDIGSHDLQVEFENYCYGPNGKPEDRFNHGIDAVRYWVLETLKSSRYRIRELGNRRRRNGEQHGKRVIQWGRPQEDRSTFPFPAGIRV